MPEPKDAELQPLEIHHHTVLSSDGGSRTSGYVSCPRAGATLSLRHCLTCERFRGFYGDADGAQTHLSCDHGGEARPAPAGGELEVSNTWALAQRTPVAQLMTRSVVCVREDVRLDTLTALLVARDVNAVPVVDETGDAVGIVSRSDILRERYAISQLEQAAPELKAWDYDLGPVAHGSSFGETCAGEIMMPVVVTVLESSSLANAVVLMTQKHIHQLPVVSSVGDVVGIVSSLDVLSWLAQSAPAVATAR